MEGRTECEVKVSKAVAGALKDIITAQPHLGEMTEAINITPYNFGKEMSEVIVVSMPGELLRNARLAYFSMHSAIKKLFPNALVLIKNNSAIPAKRGHNPNRSRESIVNDLLFPSVVAGRSTEVVSRDNMTQVVYLDPKNQFWSDSDLHTIEMTLREVFKENYRVSIFGATSY
ncbi:small subunit ribosomal protein S7e [Pancytospora epiphaga]|nr:small subunit ribosomal protein S7e [Pancytospora epiphaga]